jgi:hypothetical protein
MGRFDNELRAYKRINMDCAINVRYYTLSLGKI